MGIRPLLRARSESARVLFEEIRGVIFARGVRFRREVGIVACGSSFSRNQGFAGRQTIAEAGNDDTTGAT